MPKRKLRIQVKREIDDLVEDRQVDKNGTHYRIKTRSMSGKTPIKTEAISLFNEWMKSRDDTHTFQLLVKNKKVRKLDVEEETEMDNRVITRSKFGISPIKPVFNAWIDDTHTFQSLTKNKKVMNLDVDVEEETEMNNRVITRSKDRAPTHSKSDILDFNTLKNVCAIDSQTVQIQHTNKMDEHTDYSNTATTTDFVKNKRIITRSMLRQSINSTQIKNDTISTFQFINNAKLDENIMMRSMTGKPKTEVTIETIPAFELRNNGYLNEQIMTRSMTRKAKTEVTVEIVPTLESINNGYLNERIMTRSMTRNAKTEVTVDTIPAFELINNEDLNKQIMTRSMTEKAKTAVSVENIPAFELINSEDLNKLITTGSMKEKAKTAVCFETVPVFELINKEDLNKLIVTRSMTNRVAAKYDIIPHRNPLKSTTDNIQLQHTNEIDVDLTIEDFDVYGSNTITVPELVTNNGLNDTDTNGRIVTRSMSSKATIVPVPFKYTSIPITAISSDSDDKSVQSHSNMEIDLDVNCSNTATVVELVQDNELDDVGIHDEGIKAGVNAIIPVPCNNTSIPITVVSRDSNDKPVPSQIEIKIDTGELLNLDINGSNTITVPELVTNNGLNGSDTNGRIKTRSMTSKAAIVPSNALDNSDIHEKLKTRFMNSLELNSAIQNFNGNGSSTITVIEPIPSNGLNDSKRIKTGSIIPSSCKYAHIPITDPSSNSDSKLEINAEEFLNFTIQNFDINGSNTLMITELVASNGLDNSDIHEGNKTIFMNSVVPIPSKSNSIPITVTLSNCDDELQNKMETDTAELNITMQDLDVNGSNTITVTALAPLLSNDVNSVVMNENNDFQTESAIPYAEYKDTKMDDNMNEKRYAMPSIKYIGQINSSTVLAGHESKNSDMTCNINRHNNVNNFQIESVSGSLLPTDQPKSNADSTENSSCASTSSESVLSNGHVEHNCIGPEIPPRNSDSINETISPVVNLENVSYSSAVINADTSSNERQILRAQTPSGNILVTFLVYQDRPQEFSTEGARRMWDMAMTVNSARLKAQIESGEYIPDEIQNQIDAQENAKELDRQRRENALRWHRTELRMLEIEMLLKTHLSASKYKHDLDKCFPILDEMYNLKIEPLMLKKFPGVFVSIKKIRRYIGSVNNWDLSEEEKQIFMAKAELIRAKAEQIFSKFKEMFPVFEDKTFSQQFADFVNEFRRRTQHLDSVLTLTEDPMANEQ